MTVRQRKDKENLADTKQIDTVKLGETNEIDTQKDIKKTIDMSPSISDLIGIKTQIIPKYTNPGKVIHILSELLSLDINKSTRRAIIIITLAMFTLPFIMFALTYYYIVPPTILQDNVVVNQRSIMFGSLAAVVTSNIIVVLFVIYAIYEKDDTEDSAKKINETLS